MAKYQQYNEYKDSGVEWLGRIPHGWKVLRGKYVFQEFRERSTTGEEVLLSVSEYYGVKPRSEKISEGDHLSRAESLVDYKKCYKNDLVMNIMLAWKRGLGVSKYDGIVSPAYSVFRFNKGIHPYFMHHLFRTDLYTSHFKTRSTGVIDSRLRLYPESFLDTEILIPSYEEQAQIANFLEHETAQIDTLIEKQQILIQLLKEKRQAVISHAVTKGLNPDTPMKDSGVEWLGEVPEHWEILRLKHLISSLDSGCSVNAADTPAQENEVGVLKTSCVYTRTFRVEENKTVFKEDLSRVKCPIRKGAIIISRMNTPDLVGASAIIDIDADNIFLPDRLWQTNFNDNFDLVPEFLAYFMTIRGFRNQISLAAEGASSSMQSISKEDYLSINCILPPINEQQEIVEHIEKMKNKFNDLIGNAEQAIQLMQERRTALISAAVTGKIDVRGWVAPE